jgi:hypothetical protein
MQVSKVSAKVFTDNFLSTNLENVLKSRATPNRFLVRFTRKVLALSIESGQKMDFRDILWNQMQNETNHHIYISQYIELSDFEIKRIFKFEFLQVH